MDVSPLPVLRASYALATLQCPATQLRSHTIQVWLFETCIVCKTVIDRYLAVETLEVLIYIMNHNIYT
jgi:hypothetical protein